LKRTFQRRGSAKRSRPRYDQLRFVIRRSGFTTSATNSATAPDQIWTPIETNTGTSATGLGQRPDRGSVWGGCSFRYGYHSNTVLSSGRTTVEIRSYLVVANTYAAGVTPATVGGGLPLIGVTANNQRDSLYGWRILWSGLDFIHLSSGTPQNAQDRLYPTFRSRRKAVLGESKTMFWVQEITTGTTELITIATDLDLQYGIRSLRSF